MGVCPPQAIRQESDPLRWTVGHIMNRCRCSARLLANTTQSNSESVEICRIPRGKTNSESEHDGREESRGRELELRCGTLGPSSPTSLDSSQSVNRTVVRWNCEPAISTAHAHAQDSSTFTRKRMSIIHTVGLYSENVSENS